MHLPVLTKKLTERPEDAGETGDSRLCTLEEICGFCEVRT